MDLFLRDGALYEEVMLARGLPSLVCLEENTCLCLESVYCLEFPSHLVRDGNGEL